VKLALADLPKIRVSLVAALLAIALGAAAIAYSLDRANAAQAAKSIALRDYQEFDGKLKQVRNEENEIKLKADLFGKLQARGILGEEKRLDWIELLKSIHERRLLIELEYEIAPQRPLSPPDANPGNDLAFYASTMKLHVKLLHEEDLTRLLADLRDRAQAIIQVKSCKVGRLANGAGERANLNADCEIDWITLREAAGRTK